MRMHVRTAKTSRGVDGSCPAAHQRAMRARTFVLRGSPGKLAFLGVKCARDPARTLCVCAWGVMCTDADDAVIEPQRL